MNPATRWPDERTQALIELRCRGYSASMIGSLLGFTRNAIIGKLHRIGMTGIRKGQVITKRTQAARLRRAHSIRRKEALKKKAKKSKPLNRDSIFMRTRPAPLPVPAIDDCARVRFVDLEPHHCRWPTGHVGQPGFGFCGLDKTAGSSYCASHTWRSAHDVIAVHPGGKETAEPETNVREPVMA